MEDPKKINVWLDYLFYEVGKQVTNFRLTHTYKKNDQVLFTKWEKYLDIQGTPKLEKSNQRELLKNEIVLDIDEGDYEKLISSIRKDNYKFYAFQTLDGRARHIHLFFDGLAKLQTQQREEVRENFIRYYGCDVQLKSDKHIIPIEYTLHWKTNKIKHLYDKEEGINDSRKVISLYSKKKEPKRNNAIQTPLGFSIMIDNYQANIEEFYKYQPFFYDKNELFWFWNNNLSKYDLADKVDMMNMLDEILGFKGQTVTSTLKQNYLESFKRVGRLHIPKEAPTKWIQFKDKAFSIESGKIYDVKPNYFFTNPIPWELGETDKTPVMDKLIVEWVGEKYKKTCYQILAYCCLTNYPIHLIFCLVGCGRNGKSKFLGLMNKFIGMENVCSTELDVLLDSRFESFKLYKKLVCSMGETNFGVINKTSLLKKLTGQDLIGFEFKQKPPFDAYNYAKILISSNSLPTSEDTSEGFYRRWMILDFPNTFPEGRDILDTIPEEEYPNLALKITKLLPELINNCAFDEQGTIEVRKERYIMASNPLPLFLKKACEAQYEGYVRYSELYTAFVGFLKDNKRRIISKREFTSVLTTEGYEIRKTSKEINGFFQNDRWVEGIILKPVCDTCDTYDTHPNSFLHIENKVRCPPQLSQTSQNHNSAGFYDENQKLTVEEEMILDAEPEKNDKCEPNEANTK